MATPDRPTTAPRFRGTSATYVQAWHCHGPKFDGIVYAQSIALDKMTDGCDVESVTIVRHDDGSREYLPGNGRLARLRATRAVARTRHGGARLRPCACRVRTDDTHTNGEARS